MEAIKHPVIWARPFVMDTRDGRDSVAMLGQGSQQAAFNQGLLWLSLIVIVVTLTAVGLLALRRRYDRRMGEVPESFSLDQIRAMHERGELDVSEYETLRKLAVEQMRNQLSQKDSRTASGKEIQRDRRC